MLSEEVLEVGMDCVQECVHLLKTWFSQIFNLGHSLVNHVGQLFPFIIVFLAVKVLLVQKNFAHFDQLLVR